MAIFYRPNVETNFTYRRFFTLSSFDSEDFRNFRIIEISIQVKDAEKEGDEVIFFFFVCSLKVENSDSVFLDVI